MTQTITPEIELAGDKVRDERDGCKYCLGCVICSQDLERETDI